MSEKLFDALQICLEAIERGETVDSALKRFPAQAAKLRPILEASLHAKRLAGEAVAEDVHRRGRARVLQHAAELRVAKRAPRQRTWIFSIRPLAVTLMLVFFLLSGTGLVRASGTSLPGDNLYPVKRTWEDVTLIFASGVERDDLELTYETERVEEINGLLAKGRNEVVTFSGYVSSQTISEWKVAGVPVLITVDTKLPAAPVNMGAAVMVSGTTNDLGFLVAQSITVLAPGSIVPEIESDSHESSSGENESQTENGILQQPPSNADSANPSGNDAGESTLEPKHPTAKLQGLLESVNGTVWVINGQNVDVSGAEIEGVPAAGAQVAVEGYYDTNGVFIATRVVFSGSGGESGGSSSSEKNGSDDNVNGSVGSDDTNTNGGGGNDNGGDD